MDTQHFQQRMNHRGITRELVDLALEYGEVDQDRRVLDRKGLQRLLVDIRRKERAIIRAMDKGGVVVVEDCDCLITTYTAESYDRHRKHKN
jgi:hypothetical protein